MNHQNRSILGVLRLKRLREVFLVTMGLVLGVHARWLGNYGFAVESRGHVVLVDQPREDDGDDRGLTPVELLASSLATCIGFYVALFLKRRKISLDNMEMDAQWKIAENPHRVGEISVSLHLSRELGEREQAGLRKY